MKKNLSVLLLIAFIIPSVAFASWWNPISWFNNWSFNKKITPQVQVVEKELTSEEKIEELQKQLDELKNEKTVSSNMITPETKEIKEIKENTTNDKIKTVVSPQHEGCFESNGKWFNTITGNSCDTVTTPTKTGYELCSEAFNNGTWDGTYKSDGKLNCVCRNGYISNSDGTACQTKPTESQVQYQAMLDKIDKQEKERLQEEEDRKNSPECISATKALSKINEEIKPLQAKRDADYENYLQTGNYESPDSTLLSKLTDLTLRKSGLQSKYYAACENFYPTPQKTTTCNFIGNTMYCN